MIYRREFLKMAAISAATVIVKPGAVFSSGYKRNFDYFAVHEFIENNPEAVFIMSTHVDAKTNAAAIKQAALDFGRSVLVSTSDSNKGIPLTYRVMIKPNITCRNNYDKYPYPNERQKIEASMGIITDANFVEGVIESMKELGISGGQVYIRERSCPNHWELGGYVSMANRVGANLKPLDGDVLKGQVASEDINWAEIPDGVWFRRAPYLWPVNAKDTFMLNIAKFKTHDRGVTLTCKNFQGTMFYPYIQHCRPMIQSLKMNAADLNPNREADIKNNYERHKYSIPRWDRPGDSWGSGLHQEEWTTRCLDNHLASPGIGLHIVEGIYGRDGDGFAAGPHSLPGSSDTFAQDFMTNFILFGKNPVYIDIIGHWLAGHEPGNFGLFHIALERGFITTFNPASIPLYEWHSNGSASLISYTDLQRTPLKMRYLRQDYNGRNEDEWHLCDEPFDYSTVGISEKKKRLPKPKAFVLHQNYPNPFNPVTSIQFEIPEDCFVRIEVLNSNGEVVDIPVSGNYKRGAHLTVWNVKYHTSGTYYLRMICNGFMEIKKMTVLK